MRGLTKICGFERAAVAIAALMMIAGSAPASAQSAPSACVAELKKEYGATAGLESECTSDKDCTFQAPIGNASARALLDAVAKRAETCFTTAGLTLSKEDKQAVGTTRLFNGDKGGQCAVLISTEAGPVPVGIRTVCQ